MVGPLLAAAVIVGVVVPRATDRAAGAALSRAVASVSTVLAQRCVGLGDLARSAALQLTSAAPAARTDPATASAIIGPLAADHPGATLIVVTLDRSVAAVGPLAGRWDPLQAVGASCSRRTLGAPTTPATASAATGTASTGTAANGPALAEWADLPTDAQAAPSRVVAVEALDAEALGALRSALALGDVQLNIIAAGGATVATTAGGAGEPRAAGAAQAGGRTSGEVDGWRYEQASAPAGVPYGIVALSPAEGSRVLRTVSVVVVLACAVLVVVLVVITRRLTGPLARLTAVARSLGGGDRHARTGIRRADEVGTLAAALDAMADELQSTVEELRGRQEILSHTFARFGEALGATHDLDGLLRTVVAAARRGSEASTGIAYLGDAKTLDLRVSCGPDGRDVTDAAVLAGLADLAQDAVAHGQLVVTDLVDVTGPAMAVALTREQRVIGALAIARAPGQPPFESTSVDAVTSLVEHAGTAVANVRTHEETSRQSVTDPLTGAGNFRHLTATMAKEVERANRFSRPLSLLMLDLDHFKQVNDTAGHAFGDAVLREFARRLAACLREVDVVARYGGEEFVVVLPETAAEGACAVAARIVDAVRTEPFRAGGTSRTVTVSIGVSSFPDHGRTSAELMRSADGALYAAKAAGRDRWMSAGGSDGKGLPVAQTG